MTKIDIAGPLAPIGKAEPRAIVTGRCEASLSRRPGADHAGR